MVKECTLLEKAIIMITSRPHACGKLHANRKLEIVGFGKDKIREFIKRSFCNDVDCVEEFSQQLKVYPHLESLSYIPMNLAMIVDIFNCSEKKLPSTITQLYQLFVVVMLQRLVEKESERNQLCSAVPTTDIAEEKVCKALAGIPKGVVRRLSLFAYQSFFDWYWVRKDEDGWSWRDPKTIFTMTDLKQCGIEVTAEWDGCGLSKATHTHQLPTDTITYNFAYLTIQEFLWSVYISTLSQKEQHHLLSKYFNDYPNVFIFLCGLTGLVCREMFQFVVSNLSTYSNGVVFI